MAVTLVVPLTAAQAGLSATTTCRWRRQRRSTPRGMTTTTDLLPCRSLRTASSTRCRRPLQLHRQVRRRCRRRRRHCMRRRRRSLQSTLWGGPSSIPRTVRPSPRPIDGLYYAETCSRRLRQGYCPAVASILYAARQGPTTCRVGSPSGLRLLMLRHMFHSQATAGST